MADKDTRDGVIIDPSWDVDKVIAIIRKDQLKIKYILNTHSHWDHTCGNKEAAQRTGAQIVAHESFTGNKDYMFARTPVIQSQRVGGDRYSLFRVYSRSHGSDINTSYKIKILSIKGADDIAGSDYGQFSLHVVDVGNENVLEEFDNLTLDPASPSYFAKRIGDRWVDIDSNLFDPQKGHVLYNEYIDELKFAAECGFDAVCVNEHHSNRPLHNIHDLNCYVLKSASLSNDYQFYVLILVFFFLDVLPIKFFLKVR